MFNKRYFHSPRNKKLIRSTLMYFSNGNDSSMEVLRLKGENATLLSGIETESFLPSS